MEQQDKAEFASSQFNDFFFKKAYNAENSFWQTMLIEMSVILFIGL